MRTKRRLLSLLTAGAVLFSTMPVNALAAENQNPGGPCEHHPEHTAECGYTEGEAGTPCTFVCEICSPAHSGKEEPGKTEDTEPEDTEPENTIPENTKSENTISEEAAPVAEVKQPDGTTTSAGSLAEAVADAGSGATVTLLADVTLTAQMDIPFGAIFTLDLNGHKITSSTAYCIVTADNSHLTIRDSGTGGEISASKTAVVIKRAATLEGGKFLNGASDVNPAVDLISNYAHVSVTGENVYIDSIYVRSTSTASLVAGTYGIIAIDGRTFADILGSGYAYYKEGKAIPLSELDGQTVLTGPVTVNKCGHEGAEIFHNTGSTTHSINCPICGKTNDAEECSFDGEVKYDETHHWIECRVCEYQKEKAEHIIGYTYLVSEDNEGKYSISEISQVCSGEIYVYPCYFSKWLGTVTFSAPSGLTYGATQGTEIIYKLESADGALGSTLTNVNGVIRDFESNTSIEVQSFALPALDAGDYVFNCRAETDTGIPVQNSCHLTVAKRPVTDAVIELDSAAFRYDGLTHTPAIASVKLGDTVLTADVDYTAEIPAGTEAGTYTVTITGKGNYTGTAAAAFTVNPVKLQEIDQKDDNGNALRLEVETGLSTVPDALKGNEKYDTPAKIETALRVAVEQNISNAGKNISVFDVTLQYKDETGQWRNVDPENFPKDGVTAILPYPAGTGTSGYTFTVQHLISSGDNAGKIETLPYELTADGLKCKFMSLSPVAIGYRAASKPSSGGSTGGGSVSIDRPSEKTPDIPATGVTKPVKPDKGGNADISSDSIQDAIDKAASNARKNGGKDGIAVTVPVKNASNAKSLTITIPAEALDQLIAAKVRRFDITTAGLPTFSFTYDTLKILDSKSAGSNLRLRLTKADATSKHAKAAVGARPVYNISFMWVNDGRETPITDWSGRTVSVRQPYSPAKGEQTGNLCAVYVKGDGKVEWLTRSSYDINQKALIFEVGHSGIYGVGCADSAPVFTDIAGHWAADNIAFAVSRDLITGTGNDQFEPDSGITLGEFVTALGRLAGIDPESCITGKIMDAYITREQMAVIMADFAKRTGYDLPAAYEAVTFADNAQISSWAAKAVNDMQQAGIITGKSGSCFDPKGTATRAEAATVLRRFAEIAIDPRTAQGWVQTHDGSWQYMRDGKAVTGWIYSDKKWYWMDNGRRFAGGWKKISGKWYYFYSDGSMAANTVIDGYAIGPDGARK